MSTVSEGLRWLTKRRYPRRTRRSPRPGVSRSQVLRVQAAGASRERRSRGHPLRRAARRLGQGAGCRLSRPELTVMFDSLEVPGIYRVRVAGIPGTPDPVWRADLGYDRGYLARWDSNSRCYSPFLTPRTCPECQRRSRNANSKGVTRDPIRTGHCGQDILRSTEDPRSHCRQRAPRIGHFVRVTVGHRLECCPFHPRGPSSAPGLRTSPADGALSRLFG